MCILDENDLFRLIKEKEIFDRFNLSERQKKILKLHILKGFTFEIISGIEKCSAPAVHHVYTDAIKKIKKQLLQMLKEKTAKPANTIKAGTDKIYIGGDAEVDFNRAFGNLKVG